MRWGELGSTPDGWESFERGAFAGTDPGSVVLRLDHQDPAVARGVTLEERDDAAYMDFRVAQTTRGDELLGLVRDGIYRGASVGFEPVPGGTRVTRHTDNRRLNIRSRVALREVGATWRPVFASAGVMQVRSDMDPTATPPANPPTPAPAAVGTITAEQMERLMDRLEQLETRSRQEAVTPPPATPAGPIVRLGDWANLAIRRMSGDQVGPLELRALADIVTSDNLGVVPDAYRAELLGPIDESRPFMESTRELTPPAAGTKIIVPRIETKPTAGVQAQEKDELTSTIVEIGPVEFPMQTVGGAGDLSIQLLKRSSPEFLDLYVRLLAEAYSGTADIRALVALLVAGIEDGGVFDPESPTMGAAYSASMDATKKPPTRIWLSGAALAAFIDAKEPAGGGGRPLYPGLASIGDITPSGGGGPAPMRLRPVVVPALDAIKAAPPADLTTPEPDIEVPDIIIGPDFGFGWAEDGTYTLQADVPGRAGRDVGLVGMLWYAPLYPGAFTGYTLS